MDEPIRTFIAIPLTSETQKSLERIQKDIVTYQTYVKWVEPHNIHLTLKFTGEITPQKLKSIAAILPSLFQNSSPFEIAITHLGAFPNEQRPQVIWAGITQNAELITQLAVQIENGLSPLRIPKDDKEFSPHITLGRVRSLKNIENFPSTIKTYQKFLPITQTIDTISLFKSTLTAQGPVYEQLAEVKFKKDI